MHQSLLAQTADYSYKQVHFMGHGRPVHMTDGVLVTRSTLARLRGTQWVVVVPCCSWWVPLATVSQHRGSRSLW